MNKNNLKLLYYLPLTIWMTVFFAIPTAIIVYFSFLKKAAYGGIDGYTKFSLKAYKDLLDPQLLKILVKTIRISIIITIIVIIIAIPTAYFISRSKYKNIWLILIVIPFWTNFLVRIFALIGLLGNNGLINKLLMSIFKLTSPIPMLYNERAVIVVSIYVLMPYAILPLYTSIEKFDFSLIDAARDLGANKYQALLKVFLPGIKGGIITAIVLTFIPAIGSYAVPDIVGGTDGIMLGNVIASKMFVLRDWPSAAAISTIFIILTVITMFIKKGSDIDER